MEREQQKKTIATLTVYCKDHSPRLVYVLDWLLKEVFQIDYQIVVDDLIEKPDIPSISYGKNIPGCIAIPDNGLLWQKGINSFTCSEGEWQSIPIFFLQNSDYSIPFDLFSALFFFLSRYEEYLPFMPDKHGRFPAEESLCFKRNILERPIIDEWIKAFSTILQANGLTIPKRRFRFYPSYDIDIAYSFLHKGFKRSLGALGKDILFGNFSSFLSRLSVLIHKTKDPFDCFDWLDFIHKKFELNPLFFVLTSLHTTQFDKNNSPKNYTLKQLIRHFSTVGILGIHPSYFSTSNSVFQNEKSILETVSKNKITQSRQHYLRMSLPQTYRRLLSHGITDDWTMGYGSQLGFRAGTGRSFLWYDLEKEAVTRLRIHPFCFMDSTAHWELKLTVDEAFERLEKMKQYLINTQSEFVTVFHNFSLGTDLQWKGWSESYLKFLEGLIRA
ncbi:MAG: polysaccharide deacetylase family protein [Bacteroidetes bacterium]|nr:polysaccharide deacetylase family protein [Bacteroidota bacterium]